MIELKKIEEKLEKFQKIERKKIRAHHFLFAFLGGVGVILFWAGVWAIAETMLGMHPFAMMLSGIAILSFLGIFISETVGEEILTDDSKKEDYIIDKKIHKIDKRLKSIEEKLEKRN